MTGVATRFLTAFAQALSAMTLYHEGHQVRERAIDTAHERLQALREETPAPRFTFLGNEIVFQERTLRELSSWNWGRRLQSVGIQRLEFLEPVSREDLEGFFSDVLARLTHARSDVTEDYQMTQTGIRYGHVGLRVEREGENEPAERPATAALSYTLREEADAVQWIEGELKSQGDIHLVEAEAIVRSLSVAMHGDQVFLIPLLQLKQFDEYTTTHALNVSILAMAMAEFIGLAPREVRALGLAGLLHDMGKVSVPDEILNKRGKLSDEEREIMNRHPVEGARLLLSKEGRLELAAVVAYEHHIKFSGGGYPSLLYPRKCHQASDLVHVCDVFDALRTHRPYREAWHTGRILRSIKRRAGTEFDPELARAFIAMIRQWETRVAVLKDEDQPLPIG